MTASRLAPLALAAALAPGCGPREPPPQPLPRAEPSPVASAFTRVAPPCARAPRSLLAGSVSPDGRWIEAVEETSPGQQRLRVWDTLDGRPTTDAEFRVWLRQITVWNAPGDRMVAASRVARDEGSLTLWRAPDWRPLPLLQDEPVSMFPVSFSPDGERLLWLGSQGHAFLHDARTGERLVKTPSGLPYHSPLNQATWSPDSKLVEVGGLRDGRTLQPVPWALEQPGRFLSFRPDAAVAAWEVAPGVIRLRALPGGEAAGTLRAGSALGAIGGSLHGKALWTPDGRRLITAHAEGELRLWDVASGAKLRSLKGLQARDPHLGAPLVSPDGKRLYAASVHGRLIEWNLENGQSRELLKGAEHPAPSVYPSVRDDGERWYRCQGKTLALYETASGKALWDGPGLCTQALWAAGGRALAFADAGEAGPLWLLRASDGALARLDAFVLGDEPLGVVSFGGLFDGPEGAERCFEPRQMTRRPGLAADFFAGKLAAP